MSQRTGSVPRPLVRSPQPAVAPRVSVVVVSYRRPDDLRKSLADLLAQRTTVPFEIVLVLQAYDDAALASLPERPPNGPPVVVSRHPEPLGVFGARNVGVRLARGGIVAFLDDDTRIPPTWVDRLLQAYADSSVGGVGGYVNHPGLRTPLHRFFRWLWRLNPSRYRIDGAGFHSMPQHDPPAVTRDADWLSGGNMSFRRDVLEQIGPFEPIYGNYGFDDVDYSVRVRRMGWRLVVSHELTVDHFPSPAARDDHAWRAHEEERHRVLFARRAVGDRPLWRLRYCLRLVPHLLVITQVALVQRRWRLPLAALRGAVAGLREAAAMRRSGGA